MNFEIGKMYVALIHNPQKMVNDESFNQTNCDRIIAETQKILNCFPNAKKHKLITFDLLINENLDKTDSGNFQYFRVGEPFTVIDIFENNTLFILQTFKGETRLGYIDYYWDDIEFVYQTMLYELEIQ